MKRQWIAALVVGSVVITPAVAAAQDQDVRVWSFDSDRGRIGVMVDMKADAAADALGARIQSVIPDGPAAEAGLEAGDIITTFNGESLAGVASEDDMSGPGQRLVELAQQLEVGDEVAIEYQRGDDTGAVTVTADNVGGTFTFRSPGGNFGVRPHMELHPDFTRPYLERIPELNMFFGRQAGGLRLEELNEDLAAYFGTSEGALVMEAPRDSTLALKGGDVIVAIDGRKVESPSHATRILSSYNSGETATIEVMRQKQRMSVDWTVPEAHGGSFFFQPHQNQRIKVRTKKESRA